MTEHKSRRKVTEVQALITDSQKAFVDADGRARYPDLAATGPHGRHFSPAIRDALAFWMSHYPQFISWLAHRNVTPQQEDTP